MGNICSSDNEAATNRKTQRKVPLAKKQSLKTTVETSQSKINLQSIKDKIRNSCQVIDVDKDLTIISELGKGGQADVFEVRLSSAFLEGSQGFFNGHETFALKRIYKNCSINRRESIEVGKDIIMNWDCPFIVNGIMLYEDEHFLYELMQNATGGDMSTYLSHKTEKGQSFRQLGQEGIKFIVAGVVLGLQHLHSNNIIYCDLKLENILIGSDGYPLLTDFEMSYQGRYIRSQGYRGTANYVAPELFVDETVDRSMDLWALGVLIYAMVFGQTPYACDEVYESSYVTLCSKNEGKYRSKQKKASQNLLNLINSLMKVNPKQRIGYCNFNEIKQHIFFKGFDWYKYGKKKSISPFLQIVIKSENLRKTEVENQKQNSGKNLPDVPKGKRKGSADRSTQCDEFVAHPSELSL